MRTEISSTSSETIVIRGHDLANDLMGEVTLTELMLLAALGRKPEANERIMVDAIMVSLADHGLTPSSMAARLTQLGAPEAWQAAIAAGLLGAGSVFLGAMQECTELLVAGAERLNDDPNDEEITMVARELVQESRARGSKIYGLGHPVHSEIDPRVGRLRQLATQLGYRTVHWRLMDALPEAAEHVLGKRLRLNNVGAVGASIAALGYPPAMGRGLALAARAAGLLAHLMEEAVHPIAPDWWKLVLEHTEGAQ